MSMVSAGEATDLVRATVVDDHGPGRLGHPAPESENRVVRAGLRRFDRLFTVIVGVFGVLFTLQTGDSFVADVPTMSNPLGFLVIALVVLSVLAGLCPIVLRTSARAAFLAGVGLYAAALLMWPLTIQHPIPTDPMPWIVAVWPVPVAYAAQVSSSRSVTIIGGVLLSAYAGIALRIGGGVDSADSAVNSLFMTGIAVVLVLLLGMVRRSIVAAGEAQQAALVGFAASRTDEATEIERKRTDALLNDAVLTTFLSAAAARTADAEDLARRMAANSLRVLMHINGVGRQEAVMPFGQALDEERRRLAPLLARFEIDLGSSESIMLPEDVARAIVSVLVQAVENSRQHGSGATRRQLRAGPLGADGIRLSVSDDGCGFDPTAVAAAGLGHGHEAVLRLRVLEGRVDVQAVPGTGVTVTVSWGSDVMVGTTPFPEGHDPLLAQRGVARS